MKYVLTIDLGTSGPKVAVYSITGAIIAHTRAKTGTSLLPGGGAEQDPDEWWQAINTAVSEVLAQEAVPVSDIVAVSCTSHGMCQ